ncbi:hypothetical protein [Streptomyces sp. NBC_00887]|nr:hypothetical protein OG844_16860 [Streptomyces sp. NBC_00887]
MIPLGTEVRQPVQPCRYVEADQLDAAETTRIAAYLDRAGLSRL